MKYHARLHPKTKLNSSFPHPLVSYAPRKAFKMYLLLAAFFWRNLTGKTLLKIPNNTISLLYEAIQTIICNNIQRENLNIIRSFMSYLSSYNWFYSMLSFYMTFVWFYTREVKLCTVLCLVHTLHCKLDNRWVSNSLSLGLVIFDLIILVYNKALPS